MTDQPQTPANPTPEDLSGPVPPTPGVPVQPPARAIPIPGVQPYFTYLFMAANILVFVATLLLGDLPNGTPRLFALGWKDSQLILDGEYWRLVTPIFLHANLAHVFFNTYALYILGPQIERVFGYLRFVTIYMLSGIAGVVASVAFKPAVPSVGASGAIFGLIGTLIVYLYQNRDVFGGMGRRRLMSVLQVAGINLLIGLSPGIDNWAHIGGMVGGGAMTALLGPLFVVERGYDGDLRIDDKRPIDDNWWAVLLSGTVLGALVVLLIFLRA